MGLEAFYAEDCRRKVKLSTVSSIYFEDLNLVFREIVFVYRLGIFPIHNVIDKGHICCTNGRSCVDR